MKGISYEIIGIQRIQPATWFYLFTDQAILELL